MSTDERKPKKWHDIVKELKGINSYVNEKINKNLKMIKKIRNSCCHGNLSKTDLQKLSDFSLACFHNFLGIYKNHFGGNLQKEGFDISPIFYYFPDKEKHKEMPIDLKDLLNEIGTLEKSDPYDESGKYHVFVPVRFKLDSKSSTKNGDAIPAVLEPNNPNAHPVREHDELYKKFSAGHPDIVQKITEMNNNKSVPNKTRKKIYDELKSNNRCSVPRKRDPHKPENAKGNLKYLYNMPECVKIISKYLSSKNRI